MNKRLIFIIVLFILTSGLIKAQEEKQKNWSLNGYISNMQSVIGMDTLGDLWLKENLFHNRLNFYWYPTQSITTTIQMRNRFMYGDMILAEHLLSGYDKQKFDNLALIFNGKSYRIISEIDRAWIQYTKGSFEAKIGRQRINWSQTYVWNANDIFNVYSYFDFDYAERPGSDAIRLQYYTGSASSLEAAIKIDTANNITSAGLIRLNKWNYDIQFMGGILNSNDYAIGTGWSGNIKGAGFKGEASYFHPIDQFNDTTGMYIISLAADYGFANSLYLQIEAMYSKLPDELKISGFDEYYSGPLSVKNLAFTDISIFGSLAYPINPLLSGTFSGMYFPSMKGYYIGPSLSYSLSDNFDISVFYQHLSAEFKVSGNSGNERKTFNLSFLRFKYSF